MVGAIHGVAIKHADVDALKKGMMTMPAHAAVAEELKMLKDAGFRMVTLTNSPPVPGGKSPLENACRFAIMKVRHRVEQPKGRATLV